MRPLRLLLAAAAAAYAASQYWQERRRFAQLRALPVRQAMAQHERHRKRAERTMILLTGVVCLVAAGLAIYAFIILPAPHNTAATVGR
ncbi:MAG: hypothetical protein SF187_02800 [Deltaproteobacteria bacterium]|nr:hypothetical protein [Deltaproteobacteria bacterium]